MNALHACTCTFVNCLLLPLVFLLLSAALIYNYHHTYGHRNSPQQPNWFYSKVVSLSVSQSVSRCCCRHQFVLLAYGNSATDGRTDALKLGQQMSFGLLAAEFALQRFLGDDYPSNKVLEIKFESLRTLQVLRLNVVVTIDNDNFTIIQDMIEANRVRKIIRFRLASSPSLTQQDVHYNQKQ
uniref:Uncharacterized protein n=1 Tax=Glossina brevipalpis TaxID=37001 RepID=A0A1A9WNE0_9MUSC